MCVCRNNTPPSTSPSPGGISSMADVEAVAAHGLRRVIIGKAIYEQRITLKELEQFILSA